jgi:hypothetical protein
MSGEWQAQFERSASEICVIDVDYRIIYCNPSWDLFALQNDRSGATASHVLGRSFFAFVPRVLHSHYRTLVETSRLERKGAGRDYECHSPDKFRMYHLMVLPIPGTDLTAMVHSLRVERPMIFRPLNVSAYHHGPGNIVTMCAQCRRTKNNQRHHWNWVPEFVKNPPRRISHGICPECTMYLYA